MASAPEEPASGWDDPPHSTPLADLLLLRDRLGKPIKWEDWMSTPGFYCPHVGIDLNTGARVSTVENGHCRTCGQAVQVEQNQDPL